MTLLKEASIGIERVLTQPETTVLLKGFGESSVNFRVQFWLNDPQFGIDNIKSDLLIAIWDILKLNNIEIPFPQRDLHFKSGETNISSDS